MELARRLTPVVRDALESFRVVVVTGPRQAGKTTLVHHVLSGRGTLQRLDDQATLDTALADPVGFVQYGEPPRAIDEIQRGGDLLVRAVKAQVDADPRPGQYLLDGSADFLTVPTISESLAGRAVLFDLWPFSQGEMEGAPDGFLARLLDDPSALRAGPASQVSLREYLERVCAGGFPDVTTLPPGRRPAWFRSYVRTVTQRDIRDLVDARRGDQLPRVLRLLAARTAGELVVANVHADSGLGSRSTTEDYIGYLSMTYLVHLVPAWSRNLTTKIKRHPKVYVGDSGLAAHLSGKGVEALERPGDPARGPLVETFVVNELMKQRSWTEADVELCHLRDRDGAEVDLVVEASDGRVAGIEVKAAMTVTSADFRRLAWLRDKLGDGFVHGVVLYAGDRPLSFGDRLTALPISYLWLAD